MANLKQVVKAVGEWIEVEPRGLFEKIFGTEKADRRDKEIQATWEEFKILKKEAEIIEWENEC